jgi:pyruvate/2-oxoglutarate dehydrogenase complex dihydrolipoamide dehydrogenase (E3) component
MPTRHVDAIIIGAGQAGVPLARDLAKAGRHTLLIERAHVGGTCINEGCTPTKTMVASARVAYLARRGADYGVQLHDLHVEMARVRERKRAIVESFRSGSERRLITAGVELLDAEACFTGPHTVVARHPDGHELHCEADQVFIDTGARPAMPTLPGLDTIPALDSTSIMELAEVPGHLLVLGGGYVGLEFAQMFRRFGSRVTIVQRGAQLLEREDPDVAAAVAAILGEDGVDIQLGTGALRAASDPAGIALTVRSAAGETTLRGTHLLVATGRVPNIEALDLDAAGLALDAHGFIPVNDRLETRVPGVYALGDVKGGPAFTHISYDDYRIVRTNLLGAGGATTRERLVPYTVFIDPELGSIGLTETQARRDGRDIRIASMPMSHVARALEMDESRGFMKAVVDATSGQILGCSILGVGGGEIMAQIQIAMMGRLPYTTLRDGVFAHPTLAESLNNLFATLD